MTRHARSDAEAISLALHAEVAARLRSRPELLENARKRVSMWLEQGSVHPYWANRWHDLLSQPIEQVLELLVRPGEDAHQLRQVSPFAGVIDARSRWRILREARTVLDR